MVNLLQNKNRTDRPKMTLKTSKELLDQCDFAILIFSIQFIFPFFFWLITKGDKNHKKFKLI